MMRNLNKVINTDGQLERMNRAELFQLLREVEELNTKLKKQHHLSHITTINLTKSNKDYHNLIKDNQNNNHKTIPNQQTNQNISSTIQNYRTRLVNKQKEQKLKQNVNGQKETVKMKSNSQRLKYNVNSKQQQQLQQQQWQQREITKTIKLKKQNVVEKKISVQNYQNLQLQCYCKDDPWSKLCGQFDTLVELVNRQRLQKQNVDNQNQYQKYINTLQHQLLTIQAQIQSKQQTKVQMKQHLALLQTEIERYEIESHNYELQSKKYRIKQQLKDKLQQQQQQKPNIIATVTNLHINPIQNCHNIHQINQYNVNDNINTNGNLNNGNKNNDNQNNEQLNNQIMETLYKKVKTVINRNNNYNYNHHPKIK